MRHNNKIAYLLTKDNVLPVSISRFTREKFLSETQISFISLKSHNTHTHLVNLFWREIPILPAFLFATTQPIYQNNNIHSQLVPSSVLRRLMESSLYLLLMRIQTLSSTKGVYNYSDVCCCFHIYTPEGDEFTATCRRGCICKSCPPIHYTAWS